MKAILTNYKFTPTWLFDYPELDYLIIDQSEDKNWLKDFPQERIKYIKSIGNIDYTKLNWLVENYDNLPEIFFWGKTNLFKYIDEETFKEKLKENKFAPLLKKDHRTYSKFFRKICFYDKDGMFNEINNSWYVKLFVSRFKKYKDWAKYMLLPSPKYLAFAPGGNYILTKDRVHRYGIDFYKKMKDTLPYAELPAEAHYCERTYYSLWK